MIMQTTLNTDIEIQQTVKALSLKHIAIIMDGNRRWAKLHHLPSMMGHKKGTCALKSTVKACQELSIKYLTVYAFSTENWNRKKEEVDFLMNLLKTTLFEEVDELHENNVCIKFIGDFSRLSKDLKETISKASEKTKNNTGVNLIIALNYGARDEITNMVKSIVKKGLKPDEITEETISDYLYTKDLPEPDIVIRTSGEKRISNFLLWQIAYSEIIVVDTLWPDFDKNSLIGAIKEFSTRKRRYGK